jgi:hypothetical protein
LRIIILTIVVSQLFGGTEEFLIIMTSIPALIIFLRYFYESFPITIESKYKQKSWITAGIKISCKNKRALYEEKRKAITQF